MSQTQGSVSINPSPPIVQRWGYDCVYIRGLKESRLAGCKPVGYPELALRAGIELRGGGGVHRTATAHFKVQVKTRLELTVIWYKPSHISTLSAADHYQRVGTVQTTFWRTQTENIKNIMCNKLTKKQQKTTIW